ncbi:MAG: hypothetical protein WCK67_00575 [bacterium]
MLKKPFILSLMLFGISILIAIIFSIFITLFKINIGSFIIAIAATNLAAAITGTIYTGKYKVALNKNEKIKISGYYFAIQIITSTCLIYLLKIKSIELIMAITLIPLFLLTLIIYFSLGRGCKTKLRELEKKELLNKSSV